MSGEDALDPRKLTFSQTHGYEELPQPLKLGELNNKARIRLWGLLYQHVYDDSLLSSARYRHVSGKWRRILIHIHENLYEFPRDEFKTRFNSFLEFYKDVFLHESFNHVFDVLQEIMRHRECPHQFTQSVAQISEQCRLAYVVDTHPPVTIYPAATEEEGKAVIQTTEELIEAGFAGAVTHLRQASDCINQGDYPGAVRESIHVVESTARQIDPNAQTLEPALRSLEKVGALHPALKKAFSSLYGYTSDEQGIRHALIDNPQPNVGRDEAVFMLGACASFSSYLARKHHSPES